MIHWYASLFSHFQAAVGSSPWNKEAKQRLLAGQQCSHGRDYLKILVETSLFAEWVEGRLVTISTEGDNDVARLNRAIDEHHTHHRPLKLLVQNLLKPKKKKK